MQGASGTYAINSTQIFQPSEGGWVDKNVLGVDGNNRPIYPAVREFELNYSLLPTSDLKTLIDFHLASVTGSVVVDLPQWGASDYVFQSYSGTVLEQPRVGKYFQGFVEGVVLIIRNVRTS